MHDNAAYWNRFAEHPLDAAVIDPNDIRGYKNTYIAELRNAAIIEILSTRNTTGAVLDFGCGTGGLTSALIDAGYFGVGLDISPGLLKRCNERSTGGRITAVQFDGCAIPLADQSVEAASTYGVLMYLSNDLLGPILSEISRILKPDGRLIVIEQFRRHERMMAEEGKIHRTVDGFIELARNAGMVDENRTICRYGHFPLLYAIRYGLISKRLFGFLRAVERRLGQFLGILPWDYVDVRIVFRKR